MAHDLKHEQKSFIHLTQEKTHMFNVLDAVTLFHMKKRLCGEKRKQSAYKEFNYRPALSVNKTRSIY